MVTITTKKTFLCATEKGEFLITWRQTGNWYFSIITKLHK